MAVGVFSVPVSASVLTGSGSDFTVETVFSSTIDEVVFFIEQFFVAFGGIRGHNTDY